MIRTVKVGPFAVADLGYSEAVSAAADLAIDPADVRMGMRVQAVWKPREEWGLGIDNIDYFKPTGEPDAEYDSYKHHL